MKLERKVSLVSKVSMIIMGDGIKCFWIISAFVLFFLLFNYMIAFNRWNESVTSESCQNFATELLPNLTLHEQTLFSPQNNLSNCIWLKVPKLTKYTGIGHATSALNANILLAQKYSISLLSEYGTSGHSQSEAEVDNFFGYGCFFFRSHSPPKKAKVVKTSWETVDLDIKSRITQYDCSRGHTVFDLTKLDMFGNTITRGMPNTCDFYHSHSVLRKIFRSTYSVQSDRYIPKLIQQSKSNGDIVVTVHVRRGDVLEAHVRNKRLINFNLHAQSLHSLLQAKHKYEKENDMPHRPVKIFFLTEQAPDQDHILDFHASTGKLNKLNVTHALLDSCNPLTHCSTRVLTDDEASALQTFSAFCESDVLLTTASGFSHLAAVLCRPKLVISVPFWCPYELSEPLNMVSLTDEIFSFHPDDIANVTHEFAMELRNRIHHHIAPVFETR